MDLPFRFGQAFGWARGLSLYIRFKLGLSRKLMVPGLLHPVYLRPHTIDEYTFREIFVMKDYDLKFKAAAESQPLIIDGGANIGLSSVFFAARFPHAMVESFEPETDNYNLLVKNAEKYPNIRPHKEALWWRSGYVTIKDKGYGLRSYITEETGTGDQVPAVSLVDFLNANNYRDIYILKMDIEGAEKELLDHDAAGWISRVNYLIIELHDEIQPGTSASFFKALEGYRYSTSVSGENLVISFKKGP
jgi:FkbM family methyltransferase